MKPSYQNHYRRKRYAERDKRPKVREYLVAVRFNKAELTAFKAMVKATSWANRNYPSTRLREIALAWAGYKP